MNDPITATEVQMQIADFNRRTAPKLQATIEAMLANVYAEFISRFWMDWNDRELQQQRMTALEQVSVLECVARRRGAVDHGAVLGFLVLEHPATEALSDARVG